MNKNLHVWRRYLKNIASSMLLTKMSLMEVFNHIFKKMTENALSS